MFLLNTSYDRRAWCIFLSFSLSACVPHPINSSPIKSNQTIECPNYPRKSNVGIFPIEIARRGGVGAGGGARERTVGLNPRNYDARTRPEGSNQFIGLIRLPNRFPREIIRGILLRERSDARASALPFPLEAPHSASQPASRSSPTLPSLDLCSPPSSSPHPSLTLSLSLSVCFPFSFSASSFSLVCRSSPRRAQLWPPLSSRLVYSHANGVVAITVTCSAFNRCRGSFLSHDNVRGHLWPCALITRRSIRSGIEAQDDPRTRSDTDAPRESRCDAMRTILSLRLPQ